MLNWSVFIDVLLTGELLVFVLAILSFYDGYFTQENMRQQKSRSEYAETGHINNTLV